MASESKADAAGGEQKRHRQQQIEQQQIERLPRIPEDFQRIERQPLREQESTHRAYAERCCAGDEHDTVA